MKLYILYNILWVLIDFYIIIDPTQCQEKSSRVTRGRSPLKDRSFFRTIAPADERLRRQPVTFVKTLGSDRTVNFARI